ncbi:Protein kinase-like domain containing protein [Parasponia andersonii]|uniref:Protein kinase-like domain containing protein n=1 Tax=Parasponia andersonii TaxID=3476 RepID=A0A2P5A6E7_PARAD|nr:Protein kinase-like domain containing protein [Parasponia andersonii]
MKVFPIRDKILAKQTFQFTLDEIETAAEKFSDDNMIGEGGLGKVYKGTLQGGQNIAVKRLKGN